MRDDCIAKREKCQVEEIGSKKTNKTHHKGRPCLFGGDGGDRPSASHTYGSATQCLAFGTRLRRSKLKTVHRTVLLTLRPSRVRSHIQTKTNKTHHKGRSCLFGGDGGDRTHDLLNAIQALSHPTQTYTPEYSCSGVRLFY